MRFVDPPNLAARGHVQPSCRMASLDPIRYANSLRAEWPPKIRRLERKADHQVRRSTTKCVWPPSTQSVRGYRRVQRPASNATVDRQQCEACGTVVPIPVWRRLRAFWPRGVTADHSLRRRKCMRRTCVRPPRRDCALRRDAGAGPTRGHQRGPSPRPWCDERRARHPQGWLSRLEGPLAREWEGTGADVRAQARRRRMGPRGSAPYATRSARRPAAHGSRGPDARAMDRRAVGSRARGPARRLHARPLRRGLQRSHRALAGRRATGPLQRATAARVASRAHQGWRRSRNHS